MISESASGFAAQFDALTAVIREASRYGFSPGLGARFHQLRNWMVNNYRFARSELAPHYRRSTENTHNQGWGGAIDPLEQLLSRPSLECVLRMDSALLERLLVESEVAMQHLRTNLIPR